MNKEHMRSEATICGLKCLVETEQEHERDEHGENEEAENSESEASPSSLCKESVQRHSVSSSSTIPRAHSFMPFSWSYRSIASLELEIFAEFGFLLLLPKTSCTRSSFPAQATPAHVSNFRNGLYQTSGTHRDKTPQHHPSQPSDQPGRHVVSPPPHDLRPHHPPHPPKIPRDLRRRPLLVSNPHRRPPLPSLHKIPPRPSDRPRTPHRIAPRPPPRRARQVSVKRPRPVYNKGMSLTVSVDHWSFPSGHSSRVCFVASFLCGSSDSINAALVELRGLACGKIAKAFVWIVCLWSVVTSLSRVLLGRHFVLDVLAGACLGVVEAWLVFWFLEFGVLD
ncbi:hypothetical protein Sjap_020420 [Stephania japonica]|uniref:Phosphatidic acid phosphatase type 2/haloperoxidase domain-containing protein n=1 Tax=Stephania japonica TaxID=461633 RepID=A0AAP0F1Z3_9MAGN